MSIEEKAFTDTIMGALPGLLSDDVEEAKLASSEIIRTIVDDQHCFAAVLALSNMSALFLKKAMDLDPTATPEEVLCIEQMSPRPDADPELNAIRLLVASVNDDRDMCAAIAEAHLGEAEFVAHVINLVRAMYAVARESSDSGEVDRG